MITDHEFISYQPENVNCQFTYKPDNPLYADPSGGWMMGGPIECGGSREEHQGMKIPERKDDSPEEFRRQQDLLAKEVRRKMDERLEADHRKLLKEEGKK